MTTRVIRKAFKNGGSMAIRVPKGWLPEDAELQLVIRADGVLEVSALDRTEKLKRYVERMVESGPLAEEEIWLPDRAALVERWDWDELAGDKK
jgi:hypothetical protein